jgi:Plasma-membrane choline transporter
MTTSFGSICFGSLLVAIIQALRTIAQEAQNNGDAQIFACIAQCILGCLASIIEYFNTVRSHLFVVIVFYTMAREGVGDEDRIRGVPANIVQKGMGRASVRMKNGTAGD